MNIPFIKSRYKVPSAEERAPHINNTSASSDKAYSKNHAEAQVGKKREKTKKKRRVVSKEQKRSKKLSGNYSAKALQARRSEKFIAKKIPITAAFVAKISLMFLALGIVLTMAVIRILAIFASNGSVHKGMVLDRPMEAIQLVLLVVVAPFVLTHFITRLPYTERMQRRMVVIIGVVAVPFALFSIVEFSVTSFKPGEFNFLFPSIQPLIHFFEHDARVFIIAAIIIAEVLASIVIDFCILTLLSSRRIYTDSEEVRRLESKAGKHRRRSNRLLKRLGKLNGKLAELKANKRCLRDFISSLLADDRRKIREESERQEKLTKLKAKALEMMMGEINDLEAPNKDQPQFPLFDQSA